MSNIVRDITEKENLKYNVCKTIYDFLCKDSNLSFGFGLQHVSFNDTRKELTIFCDADRWYSITDDIRKTFKNEFGLIDCYIETSAMNELSGRKTEYLVFKNITYQEMYTLLKLKGMM